MRLEELIEQHRVYRLVAHGVGLAVGIASHQIGVHLFHLLSDEAKLRDALRVELFLVAEGYRFEREDRFAYFVHWLDRVLETLRGGFRADVPCGIYKDRLASGSGYRKNAGNKCIGLVSSRADADGTGLARHTLVADIDIVIAGGKGGA